MQERPNSALQQGLESHYSSSWCFLVMAGDAISSAATEHSDRGTHPAAGSCYGTTKQSYPSISILVSPQGLPRKSSGYLFLDSGRRWDLPRNLVFCPGVTHQKGRELFAEEAQGDLLST